MSSKGLTRKQEMFARNYHSNGGHITKAALAAGYSERSASSQGSELLKNPKVADFLKKLESEQIERLDMDADALVKYLELSLQVNPFEWLKIDKQGNLLLREDEDGNPLEPPPEIGCLITEINQTSHGLRIKLFSKESAAQILARKHGLMEDDGAKTANEAILGMLARADEREQRNKN